MIKAERLYFSYTSAPPYVLDGIDFIIHEGEYVSVVGENGCGKTTLMKLILKFLKPVSGSLTVNAKKIGYVPQKSEAANSGFPITVYEVLDSYRRLLKIKDRGAVAESLGQVGMSAFASALTGTLSGGQNQKILLARALMGSPDLLILDEPSTGVDAESQREIYGFIKKINQENKITVVSVEHNLDAAIANSTLIYHMKNGAGHMCTPAHYAEEFLNKGKVGK